jgi:hypothetical protein
MSPIIQDMPWVIDKFGEDLLLPNGQPLICPTTNRPIRAFHDQIIVWASLAPAEFTFLPAAFPIFPMLIDSGFNDSFLMQSRQAWSWMTPAVCVQLPQNGCQLPVRNAILPNRRAAVWIYPNRPGSRDTNSTGVPLRIELEDGATLAPPGPYAREKPLLGMRAIRFNRLLIRIDGQLQRVWIDTP